MRLASSHRGRSRSGSSGSARSRSRSGASAARTSPARPCALRHPSTRSLVARPLLLALAFALLGLAAARPLVREQQTPERAERRAAHVRARQLPLDARHPRPPREAPLAARDRRRGADPCGRPRRRRRRRGAERSPAPLPVPDDAGAGLPPRPPRRLRRRRPAADGAVAVDDLPRRALRAQHGYFVDDTRTRSRSS